MGAGSRPSGYGDSGGVDQVRGCITGQMRDVAFIGRFCGSDSRAS